MQLKKKKKQKKRENKNKSVFANESFLVLQGLCRLHL